ncbi:NfeD family protein [Chloroflexota bacterium]
MKIKNNLKDWLKILVLFLDEAAVIVIIILGLNFLGVDIPLPVMIIGGLLIGGLVFVIHIRVIPSFHRRKAIGREAMIGQRGEVVKPLTPVGIILVKGENWKAECISNHVETGMRVKIVGVEGLKLKVVYSQED